MTRKQVYILTALIVFIVGGTVFGLLNRQKKETADDSKNPTNASGTSPTADTQKYYTPEVPKDAKVTKATVEAPASPNNPNEKLRIFDLAVSVNGYQPDNFTINKGDTVQIRMKAVDGDYDFSLPWGGLYQSAKKDETKSIAFGATTPGTYIFQCRDHCPAGKIIKGTIVVLP